MILYIPLWITLYLHREYTLNTEAIIWLSFLILLATTLLWKKPVATSLQERHLLVNSSKYYHYPKTR